MTSGGSWDIDGSGMQSSDVVDNCTPVRQEHYTFSGHGTFLAPGQSATGAPGEGILAFAIINSTPWILGNLTVFWSWTDACNLTSGPLFFGIDWGGGSPSCNLDQIAGVPCEVDGSGPANVGPDETGPYDLSGSVTLTEHPSLASLTTSWRVVGVIGGTPSDTP